MANQRFGELIAGAEAIALLAARLRQELSERYQRQALLGRLLPLTGLEQDQVERVLQALQSYGLVIQRNGIFQMSKELKLLTSPDAPLPLTEVLQVTNIRMRSLADISKTGKDYTVLRTDDIFSVAQDIISALSCTRRFVGTAIGELMPEVKELWQSGAR